MQTSFFSSQSFLFAMPNLAPFVGVSDIGHGLHWPGTDNLARESNPGPPKRLCGMVWGSNPRPMKYYNSVN